jgi:hypothetical protein
MNITAHNQEKSPSGTAFRLPDAMAWVAWLEVERGRTTNGRHEAMLTVFIEHLRAEADRDIDRVMATVVADPSYSHYVFGDGPGRALTSWDAVRNKYIERFEKTPSFYVHAEIRPHRYFISDEGLCCDGEMHLLVDSDAVIAMGLTIPEPGTSEDLYVVMAKMALFVSYRDGLIVGEDVYWGDTEVSIAPD